MDIEWVDVDKVASGASVAWNLETVEEALAEIRADLVNTMESETEMGHPVLELQEALNTVMEEDTVLAKFEEWADGRQITTTEDGHDCLHIKVAEYPGTEYFLSVYPPED